LTDPTIDREVVAMMLRQPQRFKPEDREAWENWQADMRRLLVGKNEPPARTVDEEDEESYVGVTGSVAIKGNRVTLTGLILHSADQSFGELAGWLASNGFDDIRYGFYDGAAEFRKERAVASK
jgi:hypothetical protein